MGKPILSPQFTTIVAALAVLSAYLVSGSLVVPRISPPIFFTASLVMITTAFCPTALTAIASIGTALLALLTLSLDHIHGNCWYGVLTGGSSWHKDRLGEFRWYRQCVQPSQAWWVMLTLGLLWSAALMLELVRRIRRWGNRITLTAKEEDEESIPALSVRERGRGGL